MKNLIKRILLFAILVHASAITSLAYDNDNRNIGGIANIVNMAIMLTPPCPPLPASTTFAQIINVLNSASPCRIAQEPKNCKFSQQKQTITLGPGNHEWIWESSNSNSGTNYFSSYVINSMIGNARANAMWHIHGGPNNSNLNPNARIISITFFSDVLTPITNPRNVIGYTVKWANCTPEIDASKMPRR